MEIVLKERNIPYEFKKVRRIKSKHMARSLIPEWQVEFSGKQPDWFTKVNPRGDVPILTAEGSIIRELPVMCEFADETGMAGVKLMSEDPLSRARTRMAILTWQDCERKLLSYIESPEDERKMKRTEAITALKQLEEEYNAEAKQDNIEEGSFFLGNKFSMVWLDNWLLLVKVTFR